MNENQSISVRQTSEWGRLRAVFKGSVESLYLPPITRSTESVYRSIPGLIEIFQQAGAKGEKVHLKDALPEHYEDIARTHQELEAVFAKFGIQTYDIRHTQAIEDYFGFTRAGYCSATPESCYKVIGNILLEMGLNDTALAAGPNAFGYRDIVQELLHQDENMLWLAMPPAVPMGGDQGQGPGPWCVAADMKIIENKTIVIGIGVHDESEVAAAGKERSSTNELGVEILRRILAPFGWNIETFYFVTTYSHHADGVMSIVRPGLAVTAPNVIIGGLPPSMQDYEVIELSPEETLALGANVLPIDTGNAITSKGAPGMNEALAKRGIEVHEVDVSGTARYGAGPQCNVIAICRDDA